MLILWETSINLRSAERTKYNWALKLNKNFFGPKLFYRYHTDADYYPSNKCQKGV